MRLFSCLTLKVSPSCIAFEVGIILFRKGCEKENPSQQVLLPRFNETFIKLVMEDHEWDLGSDLHQLMISTPNNIWENMTQLYSLSSYPDSFITSNNMTGSSMEYYAHQIEKAEKKSAKRLKSNSSAPTILSFGRPNSPDNILKTKEGQTRRSNETMAEQEGAKKPLPRIQEHVIAERKRRKKLNQNFIALSAIVPGLKKMDKASVLGDAINYLKQLQEKVMKLKDQANSKGTVLDSSVLVNKCRILATDHDDDTNSSKRDESSKKTGSSVLGGIEARLSADKCILIGIHCINQKGVLVKALSEIESLNLTVINTSVFPLATSSLDITVVAQIEEGFSMTVNDLVNELNSALRQVHVRMVP